MNKNKIHPKYISKFKQGNTLYRVVFDDNKVYAIYYVLYSAYNVIDEELDVLLFKLKNSYSRDITNILKIKFDSENIKGWSDFYQEL